LIDLAGILRTYVVTMFLKVLFWLAFAFDVCAVGLLFVLGLAAAGPSHTSPLEVVAKLLLVPCAVLLGLALWFVRIPSTGSRLVAFFVVASPLAFVAVGGAMTGLAMLANPEGAKTEMSFRPVPLRDLENAVLRNDVPGVIQAAAAAKLRGRPDGAGVIVLSLNRIAKSPEQLPVLRALLDAGADPNGGYGALPLEQAILLTGPEAVALLLKAGANPNARNSLGEPVLFAATKPKVDLGILKLLLDSGGGANASSFRGESVLSHAIEANNSKAVELLLQRGARRN